mmetsp:Transcript_5182/g.12474  ORF Transcript_5182/g.12474 Transcript_5182/m.12474 type:complete len:140 (+) Transcript_5182:559-978(+)
MWRELEEELGLGPEGAEPALAPGQAAEFVMAGKAGMKAGVAMVMHSTQPASCRGSTRKHGEFECNEFQSVFLVRAGVEAAEEKRRFLEGLALQEEEVEEVRWLPVSEYVEAVVAGREGFVPRPEKYMRDVFGDVASRKF